MNSVRINIIKKVKKCINIKEHIYKYSTLKSLINCEYQIQSIYTQVEDSLEVNKDSESYYFELYPKCDISHPNLCKNGRVNC